MLKIEGERKVLQAIIFSISPYPLTLKIEQTRVTKNKK